MKDKLFAAFTVSLCFIVFSVVIISVLFKNGQKHTRIFSVSATNGETLSENTDLSSSGNSAENTSVPAGANAVLGKINEAYISPYTANTSYKNVYLKNNTELDINIENLLAGPLSFKLNRQKDPEVLIVHTHATESYLTDEKSYYSQADRSRTTDNKKNMVAIGEIVASALNNSGISTIHDKTHHDYPSYNKSYHNSAETIVDYLNKYPSIKVVIDLHRDSITADNGDKTKLTKEIDGQKAAQIMLVMGSQSGNVKNFPDYKENLKLAVRLQQKIESHYGGLARSVLLMSKNYNESLSKGSLLIEIGTDANTIKEAKYSAELLSNCLVELFSEL